MAYQFTIRQGSEHAGDAEAALGWQSVKLVDVIVDGFHRVIRINGGLKSDEDIADAVEKAAAALAVSMPVKTSALKVG